jgi:hypothetical protein
MGAGTLLRELFVLSSLPKLAEGELEKQEKIDIRESGGCSLGI